MRTYITETLEHAKLLLDLAIRQGPEAFARALSDYTQALATPYRDQPDEMNRRFMALTSGFLAVLFEGQSERIIRHQLQLSEAYIHEPDPRVKAERFLRRVTEFIEAQTQSASEPAFIRQLVLYLRMCSVKELRSLTVVTLAKAFSYHPDHLTRKIRAESDQLPSDLILDEKLRRAAQMIKHRTQGQSLKEISGSLGFQDYSYFRDLIKKRFGLTPSQL